MAEWVAGHTVDEVLLTGKFALRTWLLAKVQERIGPYDLGVVVQSASVLELAAPDEVKPEFDRVMIAQAGIRTRENEAKQDAERMKRKAQSEENEWKQQAMAYSEGRKRLADADAKAF